MKLKISSLFTGVGGAELGFSKAFGEVEHVAFAEHDKFASQTLAHNYPTVPNFGDVTSIDWDWFPKCDILHASPPCQAFSVAGKRQGMSDTRGLPLWDAFFKCLEVVHPPIFTMEEVPGLLSIEKGETWKGILARFAELGYHVKWSKLNALDFGVPQNRVRVIAVGFTDPAKCEAFQFPAPQPRTLKLKDVLEPEDQVDAKYYLSSEAICKLLGKMTGAQIQRLVSIGEASTVRTKLPGNMEPMTESRPLLASDFKEPQAVIINHGVIEPRDVANCIDANYHKGPDNHAQRTQVAIISQPHGKFTGSVDSEKIGTLREATPDNQHVAVTTKVIVPAELRRQGTLTEREVAPTLRAQSKSGDDECRVVVLMGDDGKPRVQVGDCWLSIRRLTVKECCRLMGWPDDWNAMLSNSQGYKTCGNGIVANVIEAVASKLIPTPSPLTIIA